nr:hypothetical protein [Tanacetum cinerariifolium]
SCPEPSASLFYKVTRHVGTKKFVPDGEICLVINFTRCTLETQRGWFVMKPIPLQHVSVIRHGVVLFLNEIVKGCLG